MNKLEKSRKSRGEITKTDLIPYQHLDEDGLHHLLNSDIPLQRTCAAKLLANFDTEKTVTCLCQRLRLEKKLYSKIAITESLVKLQDKSFPFLLEMLGEIGTNQEKEIPQKGFLKKSYPLPRDIAARTLCRFGDNVFENLLIYISSPKSVFALEQALDVIGHISYTRKTRIPSPLFISVSEKYRTDMVTFKIIRCLANASDEEGKQFLLKQVQNGAIGMVYAAARSLILAGYGIQDHIREKLHPGVNEFITKLEKMR